MNIKNVKELKELVDLLSGEMLQDDTNRFWFYVGAREKISAIKHYRGLSGVSLVDAKNYVDSLWDRY